MYGACTLSVSAHYDPAPSWPPHPPLVGGRRGVGGWGMVARSEYNVMPLLITIIIIIVAI